MGCTIRAASTPASPIHWRNIGKEKKELESKKDTVEFNYDIIERV